MNTAPLKAGRSLQLLFFVLIMQVSVLSDGLPGEYLLSSRWRDLMWYHSPLNNPAFLTQAEYMTLRAAVSPILQGAFTLGEVGFTVPILLKQAAGISFIGENAGVVQSSRFDETSNRLVTGGPEISNKNLYTMLSYAVNAWQRLSVGANFTIAHQTNFGEPQTGTGLDIGLSWMFAERNEIQNHLFGLSTVNLIAPSVGSDDEGAYSRDIKVSWVCDFLQKTLETGIDVDLRDFWARAEDFQGSGDLRAAVKRLEWGLSGRAGYWFLNTFGLWGQIGFDERAFEYWGLAGGVRTPLKKLGTVTTTYQYNIKSEGDLASSHTIYLLWTFGKNRKDLWKKQIEDSVGTRLLSKLKEVRGLKIEEEKEYIRIMATEVAVHFASGSAELSSHALPVLKEIAIFLRSYPGHPVIIEGHTDNDPIVGKLKERFPDNTTLSQARCQAVKDYFVATEKLPEKIFSAKGYGESRPIAPNDTKENKLKNRRVLVIVKK